MIYAIQENAIEKNSIKAADIASLDTAFRILKKESLVVSFSDSEYSQMISFFDLYSVDYKVVVSIPGIRPYSSILSERKSDIFVLYDDFLVATKTKNAKEVEAELARFSSSSDDNDLDL